MNAPLVIIALVRARPGAQAELLAAQTRLVQETRKAPGCIRYELNLSEDGSGRVAFVEQWESPALWQQHMQSPYMQAFRDSAGHLIGEFDLLQMRQAA
ncbi:MULTISPECIES: putative quinol monooxygenase [unclassified Herbaspirillum]|uniref:putative quinol monooxygenase n=1 Tax=unclassified Herbaspirillum TaxID=2624150 RepID=UPI0011527D07|nr:MULTISPECIES: putative quinol monooxygenase [unclassified Herbaspirillum]MBB5392478.1 quinol monooxygenase YgiN [Herbaspirillum sp. SJZ102]TQK06117.1 quinol monooxygenase YgiN [Herbaspirillum sp. SJZ130]TQK12405.1 quinol monooxygenase YgiN [Herbaspirillum sp. SJZ106]